MSKSSTFMGHLYHGFLFGLLKGLGQKRITLWLFNSLPWKDPPFLIGKPSISMGHLYHGELLNNQRVMIFACHFYKHLDMILVYWALPKGF